MLSVKTALIFGVPVGTIVLLAEVASGASGLLGSPVVDGAAGGGVVGVAAFLLVKQRVDRLEKDVESKASGAALDRGFERIDTALASIHDRLDRMIDQRSRQG
jgi:predicted RNA methylase